MTFLQKKLSNQVEMNFFGYLKGHKILLNCQGKIISLLRNYSDILLITVYYNNVKYLSVLDTVYYKFQKEQFKIFDLLENRSLYLLPLGIFLGAI